MHTGVWMKQDVMTINISELHLRTFVEKLHSGDKRGNRYVRAGKKNQESSHRHQNMAQTSLGRG